MADRQAHSGSLLVPLVAGLAGAGIALLLAPRSGRETREHIRGKAEDMQHRANQVADTARTRVQSGVGQAKEMKDRVRSAMRKDDRTTDEDNLNTVPTTSRWNEEV